MVGGSGRQQGGFDLEIGSDGFFDQTRLCRHEARRNPANRVHFIPFLIWKLVRMDFLTKRGRSLI